MPTTEDINALEGHSYQGLHDAVLANNVEATKALLHLGANPDTLDTHGLAPLHYAVMKNNVETARALLEAGANVEIPSEQCTNPNCAEAMRCILLQAATGDSNPLIASEVMDSYWDGVKKGTVQPDNPSPEEPQWIKDYDWTKDQGNGDVIP